MRQRVDLVLPCFNPPANWHHEVESLYRQVTAHYDVFIIIVDDGSSNNQVVESVRALQNSINVRLVSLPSNKGKGFALRKGVKHTTAPFIVYTDIDVPFSEKSVMQVIDTITSGDFDVVAGYRDSAYYQNKMSGARRLLSKTFRGLMRNVLRVGVDDTQCGLKAFNEKGKQLFLLTTIDRYLFDFEFIYRALRQKNIRVRTVPVTLKENVRFSRMRFPVLLRETFNLLKVLLRPQSAYKE